MSILKNFLISSSVVIAIILSLTCYADVAVSGYYRKNGTYVKPHMRSSPDSSFRNNWSTVGNVNPYTGKKGTKTTPTYNYNSLRSSSITSNTSYASQLSHLYDENNESTIDDTRFLQPNDLQSKANSLIGFRDYETVQLENTLKVRLNGIDWYHLAESKADITYIRKGVVGYFNNYPTVSIMYKGTTRSNGEPAWLGTRFMKIIVDCKKDKIAPVADAVVDSNNKVVNNIDYPQNARVNWSAISDYFDPDLFKSTSGVCSF